MIQRLDRFQISCDTPFCHEVVKSEEWITERDFRDAVKALGWKETQSSDLSYVMPSSGWLSTSWKCPLCGEIQ